MGRPPWGGIYTLPKGVVPLASVRVPLQRVRRNERPETEARPGHEVHGGAGRDPQNDELPLRFEVL